MPSRKIPLNDPALLGWKQRDHTPYGSRKAKNKVHCQALPVITGQAKMYPIMIRKEHDIKIHQAKILLIMWVWEIKLLFYTLMFY